MVHSPISRLTYTDLAALPDDGMRHELIGGRHFVSPAPTILHQMVLRNLFTALHVFVRDHDLGEVFFAPVDVLLSEYDVVEPDLLFVRKDRLSILEEKWVRGAPDLVVEVLSPSSRTLDGGAKRRAYRRFGVGEYWLVDPAARTVSVVRTGRRPWRATLHDGRARFATLTSPLFPGLSLDLADIFT